MAKSKSRASRGAVRAEAGPLAPGPAPQLLGPPAPIQPPPDGLVLRLGLEPQTLVVSIPGGREYTLREGPEAMGQILGILERLRGKPRAIAQAQPLGYYTKGQPLDFCPKGDAWREAAFWPHAAGRALERCPVEVVAHRVGGTVLCIAPDGKTYGLPERWLSPRREAGAKSQTLALSLEDLGL